MEILMIDNPPTTTTDVQNMLARLSDSDSIERLVEARNRVMEFERKARDFRRQFDSIFIEWLEQHDGRTQVGDLDFYVGTKRTVRCRDVGRALALILTHRLGDLSALADYLSSSPFKHGSLKDLLSADEWDECFEVRTSTDLRTGAPKQEVKSLPRSMKNASLSK
jgi:hypothetical protein